MKNDTSANCIPYEQSLCCTYIAHHCNTVKQLDICQKHAVQAINHYLFNGNTQMAEFYQESLDHIIGKKHLLNDVFTYIKKRNPASGEIITGHTRFNPLWGTFQNSYGECGMFEFGTLKEAIEDMKYGFINENTFFKSIKHQITKS